jgi:multiple sugar transport system ATP-binding protein
MTLGNKIIVLSDGHIQQAGSPLELYQQPSNEFVATFIGSPMMNLLPGKIKAITVGGCIVTLNSGGEVNVKVETDDAKIGDSVKVGIRSEHIQEDNLKDEKIFGKIALVEHLGEANFIYLTLADGNDIVLRGDGNRAVTLGQEMVVSTDAANFYLFDSSGKAFRRTEPGNMIVSSRFENSRGAA